MDAFEVKNLSPFQEECFSKILALAFERVEKGQVICPTVLLGTEADSICEILFTEFEKDSEKEAFSDFVKKRSRDIKADFSVMVCEAFTLPPEKATEYLKDKSKYPNLASHPDRIDILSFFIERKNQPTVLGQSDIKVDANKKRSLSDPRFILADRGTLKGRFVNLIEHNKSPEPSADINNRDFRYNAPYTETVH